MPFLQDRFQRNSLEFIVDEANNGLDLVDTLIYALHLVLSVLGD
jgi:hypothetical protein